jgi:hypothetical protein
VYGISLGKKRTNFFARLSNGINLSSYQSACHRQDEVVPAVGPAGKGILDLL